MKKWRIESITGTAHESFCKNVEDALNDGWKLLGQPIYIDAAKDCKYFVQFVKARIKV